MRQENVLRKMNDIKMWRSCSGVPRGYMNRIRLWSLSRDDGNYLSKPPVNAELLALGSRTTHLNQKTLIYFFSCELITHPKLDWHDGQGRINEAAERYLNDE